LSQIGRHITKEDEFENTRKKHARVLEYMRNSIGAETKAKQEAIRMKRKLGADISHVNHANAKAIRTIRKCLEEIRDRQMAIKNE